MAESQPRTVVVVEDEGLIAADLKGRLEDAGYAVPSIADTGQEALRLVRETVPDLVLMDIRLKGDMDGIQAAERLRQECDVPVVYLTAYEDRAMLARASQSQAFGYIKKPIASASLRGSIEMALAKHQQERHLREQRDWFSASFAAVPDAVVVTDGFGRISYLNRVAEELTGREMGQVLGQPSSELLRFFYQTLSRPVEEFAPVEDFVPVAMLQIAPVTLPPDICLVAGPDRVYAIEGSVTPRWQEDRVEGTVVVFRNVTARQFEQEQVVQDHKQEALLRLAGALVRHLDLELGVVADESAHLLSSLPPESGLRQNAENLEMAAMDAFAAICRLQAFAQEQEPRLEPVGVNDLLTLLVPSWKRVVPGLTLLPGAVPMTAEADRCELTRALFIVLLHARNWMRPGAGLVLETLCAELDTLGQWIRIRLAYAATVEDPILLERAFEPSWTSHAEGLPAAYRLVKAMGGFLTARLEGGATVAFEVYLRPSAAASPRLTEPARPAILLIEPNAAVRRVLHSHLEQQGYNLLEAATCKEALLVAERHEGEIPLAIAHPAALDGGRAELEDRLAALCPGISVRLLNDYWEEAQGGAPGHFLTKWDLVGWANRTLPPRSAVPHLGAPALATAARQG